MPKHFWFKFEWQKWTNDRALRRCTLETRGFWIECLCLMYEMNEVSIEGTCGEIANLVGSDARTVRRCVDNLADKNAAEVLKNGENVKVVSRLLLKAVNLKEYNKLKKREERARQNVKMVSNTPSKDLDIKTLREEEIKNKEKIKNGETPVAASAAEMDPVERRIWIDGKDLLLKDGMKAASVGPFLGMLIKENGKALVAESIAVTQAENPGDIKTFLLGVIRSRSPKNRPQVGKNIPDSTPQSIPDCGRCFDSGSIIAPNPNGGSMQIDCPECVKQAVAA